MVQLICTKGVHVRDNLLYGITIWRLRKEKMLGKENHKHKKRKKRSTWSTEKEEEEEAITRER
jgi:hypothetical protein